MSATLSLGGSATAAQEASADDDGSLSQAITIAIIVGAIIAAVVVLLVLIYGTGCCKKRGKDAQVKQEKKEKAGVASPAVALSVGTGKADFDYDGYVDKILTKKAKSQKIKTPSTVPTKMASKAFYDVEADDKAVMDPRRAEDAALRPRVRLQAETNVNLEPSPIQDSGGYTGLHGLPGFAAASQVQEMSPSNAAPAAASHVQETSPSNAAPIEQETNSDEQTRRDSFRVQQQWLHQQISQSEEFDEESEEGSPRAVATQGDIADMNWSPPPATESVQPIGLSPDRESMGTTLSTTTSAANGVHQEQPASRSGLDQQNDMSSPVPPPRSKSLEEMKTEAKERARQEAEEAIAKAIASPGSSDGADRLSPSMFSPGAVRVFELPDSQAQEAGEADVATQENGGRTYRTNFSPGTIQVAESPQDAQPIASSPQKQPYPQLSGGQPTGADEWYVLADAEAKLADRPRRTFSHDGTVTTISTISRPSGSRCVSSGAAPTATLDSPSSSAVSGAPLVSPHSASLVPPSGVVRRITPVPRDMPRT